MPRSSAAGPTPTLDLDDEREASLPPEPVAIGPSDDVHARVTRPVGDDVFARPTTPSPLRAVPVSSSATARSEARPTVPGGVLPKARPTVPGAYPGIAGELALREVYERKTAVQIRPASPEAPSEERPAARATMPIAAAFTPGAPLPFSRAAVTSAPRATEEAASPAVESATTSLSPVSTSASWAATSSGAHPAVTRKRPAMALLAVVAAAAIGLLIARAARRPDAGASAAISAPPAQTTSPVAAAEGQSPDTAPPAPEGPSPDTAAPAPARGAVSPAASARPAGKAERAPQKASPRAPHRPFDVDKD